VNPVWARKFSVSVLSDGINPVRARGGRNAALDTLRDDRRVLLDQYRVVDAAIKVVGIGSVGRRCWITLLMLMSTIRSSCNSRKRCRRCWNRTPARAVTPHHGQRVVVGQRPMQPSSDVFLGWVTVARPQGHKQFYVRQLRDAKLKPLVETMDAELLRIYAKACGRVLARAHAKTGYLGTSDRFDEAMADFAVAYADQAERDYATLKAAVKNGKVKTYQEQYAPGGSVAPGSGASC